MRDLPAPFEHLPHGPARDLLARVLGHLEDCEHLSATAQRCERLGCDASPQAVLGGLRHVGCGDDQRADDALLEAAHRVTSLETLADDLAVYDSGYELLWTLCREARHAQTLRRLDNARWYASQAYQRAVELVAWRREREAVTA